MKCVLSFLFFILVNQLSFAQQNKNYVDKLKAYQKNYVDSHEVVRGTDKKYFRFFPVNAKFKVTAAFFKLSDTSGFIMKTSGAVSKKYYRYGTVKFIIDKKPYQLTIYQSDQLMKTEEYKNYLFIPYTDLTSGNESYGGGKYLDLQISDIKDNYLTIDFNKAYNPYCAYSTGYNCPIPPRENDLPVAIKAGEKVFGKTH